ncbi:hypothetical protein [Lysinibacillus xylanilyticus]
MTIVDWSGGWATPWGLAIEERRLKPSRPVKTPDQYLTKRLAGTEVNHTL